jgi:hypothetical protein
MISVTVVKASFVRAYRFTFRSNNNLAALNGFLAYWFVTRFNGFWPLHTNWLFNVRDENIDASANYLGWEFFRHDSLLQWPIGKISTVGPAGGSSVAMTDSLPLLAILFKPLTFWFDSPFQYFGIWIFVCFILQAVFASKLLLLWVSNRFIVFLGTFFFTLAPALLDRIRFHLPLAAHWVVLAAMYLYFSRNKKILPWLVLGSITVLIHAYLIPLVAAVFLAHELASLSKNRMAVVRFIRNMLLFIAVQGISAFQSGLFIFGFKSGSKAGFGDFSANVLTLVDPARQSTSAGNTWSLRFPNIAEGPYQYEGFGFVGSGVIAIMFVVLARQVIRLQVKRSLANAALAFIVFMVVSQTGNFPFTVSVLVALLVGLATEAHKTGTSSKRLLVFLCTVLLVSFWSFSNQIQIGDWSYLVELPSMLEGLLSIFRTSGRFIWLGTYSLILLVLVVLIGRISLRPLLIIVLISALGFQARESLGAFGFVRASFDNADHIENLSSPLWREVAKRYQKIVIVNPTATPKLDSKTPDFSTFAVPYIWQDLGRLAADYEISMNDFYFSRTSNLENEINRLEETISRGAFDSNTIYVFADAPMWILAKINHREQDLIGLLDGLPVLLPGLASCTYCDLTGFQSKV